jgi:hypothetical protein
MEIQPIRAVEILESQLEAAGMAAGAMDPWEAWKGFKLFAAIPIDTPDEGLSVQGVREVSDRVEGAGYLTLVREFTTPDGDEDSPCWWVGIEFTYPPGSVPDLEELEIWSFDYPDLASFAAAVESEPAFQAAMNARPMASAVLAQEI